MRLLGGIGGFKKATQGTTTPFGAFCSKKLEGMNIGTLFSHISVLLFQCPYVVLVLDKEIGHKTTLQGFLTSYTTNDALKEPYKASNKEALLTNFLNVKKAKESVPMRKSNVAISLAVSSKMKRVTASVCFYSITFLTYFSPPF